MNRMHKMISLQKQLARFKMTESPVSAPPISAEYEKSSPPSSPLDKRRGILPHSPKETRGFPSPVSITAIPIYEEEATSLQEDEKLLQFKTQNPEFTQIVDFLINQFPSGQAGAEGIKVSLYYLEGIKKLAEENEANTKSALTTIKILEQLLKGITKKIVGILSKKTDEVQAPQLFKANYAVKVLPKVIRYCGFQALNWRLNPQLPKTTAERINETVIAENFLRMLNIPYSPSLKDFSQQYENLTTRIKKQLLELGVPEGKNWSIRKDTLWAWCYVNIENVIHPLLDTLVTSASEYANVKKDITDIKVRLVVFNVLLDDIADNFQKEELFNIYAQIPFASQEELTGLRLQIKGLKLDNTLTPLFEEYFDFAAKVWANALTELETMTGPEVIKEFLSRLVEDYKKVIASMRFSVKMNKNINECSWEDATDILPHNMNMMAFKTIDDMILKKLVPSVYEIVSPQSKHGSVATDIFLLGQRTGQIGNSTATAQREVEEGDFSNEVFFYVREIINDIFKILSELKETGTRIFLQCCELDKALGTTHRTHYTSFHQLVLSLKEATVNTEFEDKGKKLVESYDEYKNQTHQSEKKIAETKALFKFFEQWETYYQLIQEKISTLPSPQLREPFERLLKGYETLLVMHLVFKGEI